MRLTTQFTRKRRQLQKLLGLKRLKPWPHFLGIGAQKAGTTSLYELLRQHDELFLPERKELQYFSLHLQEGAQWYLNHFASAKAGQLRGEISPYYLFHPAVPERIFAIRPTMKLIVLLRHPIERTVSHVRHSQRLGFEPFDLENAIASEHARLHDADERILELGHVHRSHREHSYVARSHYEQQLPRYFNRFGRDQVLVLKSETFLTGDHACLRQLTDFLGVSAFPKELEMPKAYVNPSRSDDLPNQIRNRLEKEFAPTFEWLYDELNLHW